jgi:hypothetical protein
VSRCEACRSLLLSSARCCNSPTTSVDAVCALALHHYKPCMCSLSVFVPVTMCGMEVTSMRVSVLLQGPTARASVAPYRYLLLVVVFTAEVSESVRP